MPRFFVELTDSEGLKRGAVHNVPDATRAKAMELLAMTAAHNGWTDLHVYDIKSERDWMERSNAILEANGESPRYDLAALDQPTKSAIPEVSITDHGTDTEGEPVNASPASGGRVVDPFATPQPPIGATAAPKKPRNVSTESNK